MTTELQQADAVQLRTEIESIRLQMNGLMGRLVEVEQRLNSAWVPDRTPGRPHGISNEGRSLEDFMVDVLQNSNEPLTAKEVADLVLDAGYKTKSKKNFVNIVLQAMVRSVFIRRATRVKQDRLAMP